MSNSYRQTLCRMPRLIKIVRLFYVALIFYMAHPLAENSAGAGAEMVSDKKTVTPSIRAEIFAQLEKAQAAQEKGDIKKSLVYLDSLKTQHAKKPLNSYELAQMWNFYAYAYLADEDYRQAINAFEKLMQQPDLPPALISSTQYTLAQVTLLQGHTSKTIQLLDEWFRTAVNPQPEAYLVLAKAYVLEKRYNDALDPLLTAIDVAEKQGKAEKEEWYVLLQYIYSEKKDYLRQEAALKKLVTHWPDKNYWLNLYGVYVQLGKEDKQLYVLESLYEQSMLNDPGSLIPYVQMLAAQDIPYKAAKIMEKGFADKVLQRDAANIERVGQYWQRAQEIGKALPYYTELAALSENGESHLRLAHLYLGLYDYSSAIIHIESALAKGRLKKPMEARFLLAQTCFHAKQYDKSVTVFRDIQKMSGESGQVLLQKKAGEWLMFVNEEIQRLKELDQYLTM